MTDFALNILGAKFEEVTSDNLRTFFNERRLETENSEFKSFAGRANLDDMIIKILKTLCGFLNGSGGLLIAGAPPKTTEGMVEYFTGPLTPCATQQSVDWFINKINSGIMPMPINTSVRFIEMDGGFLYIFQVQESQYKPHQFQHTYHIRLDGQTKPAPHYVVQALMRQITYPDLRASFRINPFGQHAGEILASISLGIFNFSQLQNEVDYNYMLLLVGGAKFFGWKDLHNNNFSLSLQGAQLTHSAIPQPLHYGIPYCTSYRITIPHYVTELKVVLTFGGRLSPAKTCIYSLNLLNCDSNDPQLSVIIEEDNQLFQEKQSIDETLAFFRNNQLI